MGRCEEGVAKLIVRDLLLAFARVRTEVSPPFLRLEIRWFLRRSTIPRMKAPLHSRYTESAFRRRSKVRSGGVLRSYARASRASSGDGEENDLGD